ncbi:MAG: hypothetical protein LBL85_05880 [Methanocalculaceae archaeon]|jgi:hypothetical protein|nr:hypothetical protein [Methanocalculaceae archaeon]
MAEKQSGNLTAADFYHALYRRFDAAAADDEAVLEVSAGELHKTLKAANRLSLCGNCLYDMQNIDDVILNVPAGGVGSTLLISYSLPRDKGLVLEKSIYSPAQIKSGTGTRTRRFEELASLHPIFRELAVIARQKKSETATRKLCDITAAVAELICRTQKIRIDNKKFGTVCGAIGRCGVLSPEGLYALDLVRIIGNTHARKIPDAYLMTPEVFAYASHAFVIFADEIVEKRLIWKKTE